MVIVRFKKPGAGMYVMTLQDNQKLQFVRGRARRIPKDEENIFNTIPIKYITSVQYQKEDVKEEGKKQ